MNFFDKILRIIYGSGRIRNTVRSKCLFRDRPFTYDSFEGPNPVPDPTLEQYRVLNRSQNFNSVCTTPYAVMATMKSSKTFLDW